MKYITTNIREYRTDNGNTKHRTFCCVFGIASTSQTAHVDNLGNLEEDGYDNDIGNTNTNRNDMWLFWEEEAK